MHIAFAGVSSSHPFSDAALALATGIDRFTVWDADDASRRDAFASRFGATRVPTLDALIESKPDLVISAPHSARLASVVARVLDAGLPCYQHKVALPTRSSLATLNDSVSRAESRFMTSSVLRFAPQVEALRRQLAGERMLSVSVSVRHDIADFLTSERRWIDDPRIGGGTAMTLGLHGWDIASALLGERLSARGGVVATRLHSTASEDVAYLSAITDSGVPVRVDVIGASSVEEYRISVDTAAGTISSVLHADSLGYAQAFNAAMGMVATGLSPVPWPVSRNVLETAITAARFARQAVG